VETSPDVNVDLYKWKIENKYYKATIHFCKITEKKILMQELKAAKIEAVIVYFDCQKDQNLQAAEEWIPILKTVNAEVKILVCDQFSIKEERNDKLIKKIDALQWCIKNGFELVELKPSEIPDPEDDFPETLGIQRITQALNAHAWSNLEMKADGEKSRIDYLNHLLICENDVEALQENNLVLDEYTTIERQISEGVDSFEELFQSMSLMKNQAANLQGADRKEYAEKVTMAFWRAIDGDIGEIEGLDSSDGDGNDDTNG